MRILLRLLSLMINTQDRSEWIAEWWAEASYVRKERGLLAAACFVRGAFIDAAMLFRRPALVDSRSPLAALALLFTGAVTSTVFAPAGAVDAVLKSPWQHTTILALAALITTVSQPSCLTIPPSGRALLFLAVKATLAVWIVFYGLPCLVGSEFSGPGAHGSLVGYAVALTWVYRDQRQRCRKCLRRLRFPVTIGDASHVLLAWYGTESVCDRGHGLMYVSAVESSASEPQRWFPLHSSWAELFRRSSDGAPI